MVGLAAEIPSAAGFHDANCASKDASRDEESDREKPSCNCGAESSAREKTGTKRSVKDNKIGREESMATRLATRD